MSNLGVANLALSLLGARTISSFPDTSTKEGRAVSTYFETVRQSELRKYNWNFAMQRDVLTVDFETPAWGWDHQYAVPDDYLRLVEVDGLSTTEYQVEKGLILTNTTDDLNIRYVYDASDPDTWDQCFVDAFGAALARRLTEEITASATQLQLINQTYKDAIKDARQTDAIENPPEEIPEDDWNLARL